MNEFTWTEPETIEETLAVLSEGEETRLLAGGTALGIMIQQELLEPCALLCLRRLRTLPPLSGIRRDPDGTVRIGALTTLREMELSDSLAECAPVLVQALHTVANPRIRNMATLGGHLAYGEPHLDLPPVLLAMDGSVRIASSRGERQMPLSGFLQGYYSTALEPDELLTEILFHELPASWSGSYARCTSAAADDWPMVGLATFVKRTGDTVSDVRLVVSGICPAPVRLSVVEQRLKSSRPSAGLISEAARDAGSMDLEVTDDIRGTAWYKKEILQVLVRRELERVILRGSPRSS